MLQMSVEQTKERTVYKLTEDDCSERLIVSNRGEYEYTITDREGTRRATTADCLPYMKKKMIGLAMRFML